jgi:hypothetical protein
MIIVMGIFIVLAATVRFFPIDFFYARSLDDDAAKIAFTLRGARDRSVTQQDAGAWGVHFVNPASGGDYYQVFRGDTYAVGTVVEQINLNETVQFTTPPVSSSTDVLFSKINGLPSGASSVILSLISKPATTHTVTVLTSGQIQY